MTFKAPKQTSFSHHPPPPANTVILKAAFLVEFDVTCLLHRGKRYNEALRTRNVQLLHQFTACWFEGADTVTDCNCVVGRTINHGLASSGLSAFSRHLGPVTD